MALSNVDEHRLKIYNRTDFDMFLDKESDLGIRLKELSDNVDLECLDELMKRFVKLITTRTNIISRYSCEGHVGPKHPRHIKGGYLMLTGDVNDYLLATKWVELTQRELIYRGVKRNALCLEYRQNTFTENQQSPVFWYPAFTIRFTGWSNREKQLEFYEILYSQLLLSIKG